MTEFDSSVVRKSRKAHRCEQCNKLTEIGAPYQRRVGVWDGDFYAVAAHVECHAAALAYATLHGCWGDEYPFFSDGDHEYADKVWMVEEHPIVAERLGWKRDVEERQREDAEDALP